MAIGQEIDIRDHRRHPAPCQNRSHEYFVPKDGIDREVITADICRYLGNDALVRPGTYEAMIEDLKADSQRWDQERRATDSRGNGTSSGSVLCQESDDCIAGYTQSCTYESRQNLASLRASSSNYPLNGISQQGYDQFSNTPYSQASVGGYAQPSSLVYMPQENYHIAGSGISIEQSHGYPPSVSAEFPTASTSQYVQVPSSQQYSKKKINRSTGRGMYSQPSGSISNSRRGHEDSNYAAPIIIPTSYQEEISAYYPQTATGLSHESSYRPKDAYSDRNYLDPGSYNCTPMGTHVAQPQLSQHRLDRDRESNIRDAWSHRNPSRRH